MHATDHGTKMLECPLDGLELENDKVFADEAKAFGVGKRMVFCRFGHRFVLELPEVKTPKEEVKKVLRRGGFCRYCEYPLDEVKDINRLTHRECYAERNKVWQENQKKLRRKLKKVS